MHKVAKYLSLFLFLTFHFTLVSQQCTLSGYITDCKTGEKLIGVNIQDVSTGSGSVTNSYGFYSLTISCQSTIQLQVSYIGYEKKEVSVKANEKQNVDIKLCPKDEYIETIDVIANQFESNHKAGVLSIPMKDIKALPSVFGQTDVLRVYMLMPGVQGGKEGTSELYVRGGSPDQNLFILDDVPLYYVNHIGGFVSVFNDDAINKVELIKGGFPARYGGRLSGITDIRMKDGNLHNMHGGFNLGIVSAKAMIEGPLKKEKVSFLVSARRSLMDIFLRPISLITSNGEIQSGYTFYDVNAKLQYILNHKNRLYFSFYTGNDRVFMYFLDKDAEKKYEGNNKIVWGNILGSVRWNYIFSTKLFLNTTFAYTKFQYNTDFIYESNYLTGEKDAKFSNRYISNIADLIGKADFDYSLNRNNSLKFGLNLTYHTYTPGVASFKKIYGKVQNIDTTLGSQLVNAIESSIYLEDEIMIGQKFTSNIGLRYTNFYVEKEMFQTFQPRLTADYRLNKNFAVKASYTQMTQNIHLLTNSSASQPTDLWIPATPKLKPENSIQYSLGVSKLFHANYEVNVEGFYKTMDNLIEYKEGASFFSTSKDWQDKVEIDGRGKVYGIEAIMKKNSGVIKGWIAYTWSKNTRQFARLNFGNPYPYKYDRRNDIALVILYAVSDRILLSANWVYSSGYYLTMPVGKYNQIQEGNYFKTLIIQPDSPIPVYYRYNKGYWQEYKPAYIYNGKNNYQTNSSHRLDISITFTKKKKKGTREFSISIYNVYNHLNPYYIYYKYENKQLNLYQYSMFPFLPSFSYSYKF